jgi:D-aspartate ligase
MAENEQPKVVIVGLNRHPGLQAARILAARGVPVIGMATDPKHYCCRTNVCEEIIVAASEHDYVASLEALGPRLEKKAVIVPCSDALVELVSENRDRLAQWFHILLPDRDTVRMLMDKVEFYAYAEIHGFRIPRTRYIRSPAEVSVAASDLAFPVVVKPPNRSGEWSAHTTRKIYRLDDAEALEQFYQEHQDWTDTLIVQEYVAGPDANLVSINFYCNAEAEALATFVSRKVRQWPPGAGDSCYGEECRDDEVLDATVRLCKKVNYRGIGYLEAKRDDVSGEYFIIEPNVGRPTGRSAIAEAGGVELLYTMYCDAVGLPLPSARQQSYGSARWIHLRKDFQAALYYWRRGELTLREWFRSWRGKKAYAIFSWRDPRPFIGDLGKVLRIAMSSRERRKRGFARDAEDLESGEPELSKI